MLKNRFNYGIMMLIGAVIVLKYGYTELRYLVAFLKMKANLSYTNVGVDDLLLCLVLTCVGLLMILFAKIKILEYENKR